MKGRPCIAGFFAIIALLILPHSGHSKTASTKQTGRTAKPLDSAENYSVRAGDSLYKIARKFGTTEKALRSANQLKGSKIKIGQILSIPVLKAAAAKAPAAGATISSGTANETYMTAAPKEAAATAKPDNSDSYETRLRLVNAGFELVGVRYRFGGSGNGGFDCSGLVKTLFSQFDIDLPRSSREQFKQGQKVNRDELQIGDLVFFSSGGSQPNHVGIYVGDNRFLHAARKARKVIVSDLGKLWYTMRYIGARRVMDLWSDEPVSE